MWDTATSSTLDTVQKREVRHTAIEPSHMGLASEAKILLRAPLIESRQVSRKQWRFGENIWTSRHSDISGVEDRVSQLPLFHDNINLDTLFDELTIINYKGDYKMENPAEEELDTYFMPIGRDNDNASDIGALHVRERKKHGRI